MSSSEILKLVGACIGMLVAAVVGLVLFFRGLTWFDQWIKQRLAAGVNKAGSGNRKKKKRVRRASEDDESDYKLRPVIRPTNAPVRAIPNGILPEPRFQVEYVDDERGITTPAKASLSMRQSEPATAASTVPPISIATDDSSSMEHNCSINIHLLSGEVYESVSPLSEEERASLFADQPLLLDNFTSSEMIVFVTSEEAKVCIVMKSAIKQIVVSDFDASHVSGGFVGGKNRGNKSIVRSKNNPRDGRPSRRTIP